jgi:hypothetical protein
MQDLPGGPAAERLTDPHGALMAWLDDPGEGITCLEAAPVVVELLEGIERVGGRAPEAWSPPVRLGASTEGLPTRRFDEEA